MDYLTIFPETIASVQRYPPEDRCLLYEAMAAYAFTGEQPDWSVDDIKWFVWESLKQRVESAKRVSEARRQSGANGAKAKQAKANESKSKQIIANDSKPKQTEASASKTSSESEAESESESESEAESEADKENGMRVREKPDAMVERFNRFWASYPRHTDKKGALKAFGKIKPDEPLLERMLAAVAAQKQSDQWTRDNGAYIPHPSTWLNQERWNDELPKPVPRQRTVVAQQYEQRDYSQQEAEPMPEWMMERWKQMQEGTA